MNSLSSVSLVVLVTVFHQNLGYKIGTGTSDITGPCVEVNFMGYAKPGQTGVGIHTRQWARTTIVDDGENRFVFTSTDNGMMSNLLREAVVEELTRTYGDLYNLNNVMISGTHTHSTPGGFVGYLLYDLSSFGFVPETFLAYKSGIVRSVHKAHDNMQEGRIFLNVGEVRNASYNRSPQSYMNNPEEERGRYDTDTDKQLVQLKLVGGDGKHLGVVNWFAVHPTSMNNTNKYVSSDNQGLAAIMFEKRMDETGVIGKTKFQAVFASTNLGDVSPNIMGPYCSISGVSCDNVKSECPRRGEECRARGPGGDMYESTWIIAERIFEEAWSLYQRDGVELTGPVRMLHQYVDMTKQTVDYYNRETGQVETVRGCLPAMGASFAAGTSDGPGVFPFKQGSSSNPLWNAVSSFLPQVDEELAECHHPKPILLPTGAMEFPFAWQPSIVSTSVALIGNMAIVCVPGEFTTMSGRRLRDIIKKTLEEEGLSDVHVTIAGLCNTYSSYITTPEEYQVQRYEGASTIYGPYTLPIYLQQYEKLSRSISRGEGIDPGPKPNTQFSDMITLVPPVLFDTAPIGKKYGDVLKQLPDTALPGDTVTCRLVGANPRNDLRHDKTYLTVEMLDGGGDWVVIATDANWETKFRWIRKSPVLGTSEVVLIWTIPHDTKPGKYRMRHFGAYRYIFGGVFPYQGKCGNLSVVE